MIAMFGLSPLEALILVGVLVMIVVVIVAISAAGRRRNQ
jgi:hypothetical protein